MNKLRTLLIVTLAIGLVTAFAGLAMATDYYVDAETGADGSGDGSINHPWASIIYAVETGATGGDTIWVDDGTYTPDSVSVGGTSYSLPIGLTAAAYTIAFCDWEDSDHGDAIVDGENTEQHLFDTSLLDGKTLNIYSVLTGGDALTNKAILKNTGDYATTTDVDKAAIYLDGDTSDTIDIYNLDFQDNEIGIETAKAFTDLQIYKNDFSESSSGTYYGILISEALAPGSGQKEFYENSFTDLAEGIYVTATTVGTTYPVEIVDSTFSGNTIAVHIAADQTSAFNVNFNNFDGTNTDGVLLAGDYANTVDFSYNWWGDKSGPENSSQNSDGTGDTLESNLPANDAALLTAWTSQYWFSHAPALPLRSANVAPTAGSLGASISLDNDTTYEILGKDIGVGDVTKYGAVDHADDGDTVDVAGGKTYSVSGEDYLINTNDAGGEVAIVRDGGTQANTILDGTWVTTSRGIHLEQVGDTLGGADAGFTINMTCTGVCDGSGGHECRAVDVDANEVTVQENAINNAIEGVYIRNTENKSGIAVKGNTLTYSASDSATYSKAITYAPGKADLQLSNSLITGNTIANYKAGVNVQNVVSTTISNNDISDGYWCGIAVGTNAPSTTGNTDGVTITGNTISNINAAAGSSSSTTWNAGIAIDKQNGTSSSIKNITVEDNTVTGCGVNLGLNRPGNNAPISQADMDTFTVQNNTFEDSVLYGVYNGHTATLDATNNWWGASDGPSADPAITYTAVTEPTGSGDVISDFVEYDPYKTSITAETTLSYDVSPEGGAGWVLVSFPLSPTPSTVTAVFGDDITTAVDRDVTLYTSPDAGMSASDTYDDLTGSDTLSNTEGYWVALDQPETLTVNGEQAADGTVTVTLSETKWHLISVPFNANIIDATVDDGRFKYGGVNGIGIWDYNASEGTYDVYTSGQSNDFILSPWKGYWVKVYTATAEVTFVESAPGKAGAGLNAAAVPVATMEAGAAGAPPAPPVSQELNLNALEVQATASSDGVTFSVTNVNASSIDVQVFAADGSSVFSDTSAGSSLSWDAEVANGLYLYTVRANVGGEVLSSRIQKLLIVG